MVKLSVELITKLGPGHNKRRPDESTTHYLNRLTHIYLQEKNIEEIEPMPTCKNLTVIYLYDNNISKIENLEFAPNLTHLYLHNNQIKRLENLNNLTKLTKLHIGGNQIKVVEGLENLTDLIELQIENQDLPSGEKLLFDPRTLMTLVNKLQILNVSGNNLDSLSEIGSLRNLEQLIASNNCLSDMKEMVVLLKCWPKLWKLELTGNPLCLKNKYRERIIVLTPHLEMLDGKEIQEMSRQFLQNWKTSKEIVQQRGKNEGVSSANDLNANGLINSKTDSFTMTNHASNSELPRINKINSMPSYVMPDGYQIIVPIREHKKKQFIRTGLNGKLRSNPADLGSNLLATNKLLTSNNHISNSLNSLFPSATLKNNGFTQRFTNLSAKNKVNELFLNNEYRNNINSMNKLEIASPFINANRFIANSANIPLNNKNILQTGYDQSPKK